MFCGIVRSHTGDFAGDPRSPFLTNYSRRREHRVRRERSRLL
ncbi:hypothetical protein [uncultured Nostoc sp.]